MATSVESIIRPELETIKAHLAVLFAPVREHYPDGLIEIRHGVPGEERLEKFGHAYFAYETKQHIEAAAEFAAARNGEGRNVYVGVNARKKTTNKKNMASADDVAIAVWHFADFDDADAVSRLAGDLPVKPYFTVTTGIKPFKRPHFYWLLDEPVSNFEAWTERQSGIAQSLGGDHVIDPPRIMRVAGTVNYPTQKKMREYGRVSELVTMRTEFADEREAVSPEQIAAAYPARHAAAATDGFSSGALIETANTKISHLIARCQAGDEWHNSMIRLVAHLVSTGRTSAEILALGHAITLPGYNIGDTQREMAAALRSARTKWDMPEPEEPTVEQEEARREDKATSVFDLIGLDEIEDWPPPSYLIDGLITDHGLTFVYGEPGCGKSFVALDATLRMAYGMDWHGREAKQTGTIYVAGEGARGFRNRVMGWRKEHGLEGVDAPFRLLPYAVQMLDEKECAKLARTVAAVKENCGFNVGMIVIDTVSRSIAGADENKQETMSGFIKACDAVRATVGGAMIAIHHSGKDKERGLRGSSVLLGAADTSLKISKSETSFSIRTEKQKDDEEAEDIYLSGKKVEWVEGLAKEQSTLVLEKRGKPLATERDLSRQAIESVFDMVDRAWADGAPLSPYPHARRTGRYIVDHICKAHDIIPSLAESYVQDWQLNGMMETVSSRKGGPTGLRILEHFVAGE